MTTLEADETLILRPWVDHYPPEITWDSPLNTTPVHEQVAMVCAQHPEKVALDFLGKETTFGELGKQIEAFAGALQKQFGMKRGSRVALMLPNTPYYVVAYYAILRTGATVVNCNPLYTVHELRHIVSNSGADIIVTLDVAAIFEKAEALADGGHIGTVITCHLPNALPMVKKVLYNVAKRKELADVRHSKIAGKVVWFDDLIARGDIPTPVAVDPKTDVAVQQYTGGTTGLPKGAMLSHLNIAANVSQIDKWGCGLFYPPSVVIAVLPFFHIFAMTVCMNVPLSNGTKVVMLPRFELKAFLDLMQRAGVNVLPAVPTLLGAVARAKGLKPEQLAKLEVAISGGAPLPHETREAFAKVSPALLAEGYGLTEASPVVCCAALRVPSKPMSIGQPLPGTDIRFVDHDTGKVVGLGERGELQVKGPQVMLGYYNDEEATKGAFMDGWLRTGDVGYIDDEGYVFLVDRIKDLIICSGFNVYPRTIEEALSEHPAVEENNVIGVPDSYRGEAPVAFVKLREGHTATEQELKTFLGEKLNKIEMPTEIIFKEQLPKTLIGKLSKKELRTEYAERQKEKASEPA